MKGEDAGTMIVASPIEEYVSAALSPHARSRQDARASGFSRVCRGWARRNAEVHEQLWALI